MLHMKASGNSSRPDCAFAMSCISPDILPEIFGKCILSLTTQDSHTSEFLLQNSEISGIRGIHG